MLINLSEYIAEYNGRRTTVLGLDEEEALECARIEFGLETAEGVTVKIFRAAPCGKVLAFRNALIDFLRDCTLSKTATVHEVTIMVDPRSVMIHQTLARDDGSLWPDAYVSNRMSGKGPEIMTLAKEHLGAEYFPETTVRFRITLEAGDIPNISVSSILK